MSNDSLKELFNDTFDKEVVNFDPAAWDGMNALLDRQRRRKLFWIWMSNGTALVILSIAVLYLFQGTQTLYQPRTNALTLAEPIQSETANEHSLKNERFTPSTDQSNSPETGALNQAISSPMNKPAYSNKSEASLNNGLAEENTTNDDQATTWSETQTTQPTPAVPSEPKRTTPTPIASAKSTPEVVASDEAIEPIAASVDNRRNLSLLPALVLEPGSQMGVSPKQLKPIDPFKSMPDYYLRIALSKNFMLGTGQELGIGISHQVGNHLLVSGELMLTRDNTYYNIVQERISYGYDINYFALRIWASEMVNVELPLMLRYRWNRLTAGSGLTLGLLATVQVTEETLFAPDQSSDRKQPIGNSVDAGYVNWSDARSLQLSIPIDVQYQLDERYSLGTRMNLGLTDAFQLTPEMDRMNHWSLYLKMNLQR